MLKSFAAFCDEVFPAEGVVVPYRGYPDCCYRQGWRQEAADVPRQWAWHPGEAETPPAQTLRALHCPCHMNLTWPLQADDLLLLCKRHATSKLRSFEDLDSLSTLGFRGEALASISSVAHLSVVTKTAHASAGSKAHYKWVCCAANSSVKGAVCDQWVLVEDSELLRTQEYCAGASRRSVMCSAAGHNICN